MSDMGFLVSDTLNELFWLELLLAKGIFSPVPHGSREIFRTTRGVLGCCDGGRGTFALMVLEVSQCQKKKCRSG